MSKQINIRLDEIHYKLLEQMVETLEKQGVKTNKTDVIQKALYIFAKESVLDSEIVTKIIDRNYTEFFK
ncbi:hypothetical protein DTX80_18020 [Bacilli bacterium]|uniref:hypothetical protein n=1 Tax=Bacteria TaxID=2 RepID=UPI0006228DFC|nr:hypothetical protein [Pseudomonas cedrina]KKE78616.1 hypothetical protein WH51_11755 [Bacilli bacterium VT-13-104]PZD81388.1 hypothetical protein DEJ64_17520 [Bacilli bacterium]HAJ4038262.1 hypothetical protein [Escherichia coli]PZD83214.1 hypothetical protein DEJ60_17585 [Bacilli bacterium]PZD84692.1 hypothetical protein DEJ66_17550 [Bacilli bacterium]